METKPNFQIPKILILIITKYFSYLLFDLKVLLVTLCFRYIESGLNISAAQKFNNVINKPLVTGPDDQLILGDTFLFPEHHVFTGIVSKLIKE